MIYNILKLPVSYSISSWTLKLCWSVIAVLLYVTHVSVKRKEKKGKITGMQ